MSALTYQSLLQTRQKWKPWDLIPEPLSIDSPRTRDAIERCLALALNLELPVGTWVAETTRKNPKISQDAIALLRANIGDENIHFHAFKKAAQVYPVREEYLSEADKIAEAWNADPSFPLLKSATAETGVFLISLALMRLCGGKELTVLSAKVSQDEQRHVTTNLSVCLNLGMNPFAPNNGLEKLRLETLDWMVQDIKIPELGIDADWLFEQSEDLMDNGSAPELSHLTDGAQYTPDFETESVKLY